MKRPSYKDAIDWVAQNDSAGDVDADDPRIASELITAVMVAHLFDVPHAKVGADIVNRREAIARDEERERIRAADVSARRTNRATQQERTEFGAFLKRCTDAQVLQVLETERAARRTVYVGLAGQEAARRGLVS